MMLYYAPKPSGTLSPKPYSTLEAPQFVSLTGPVAHVAILGFLQGFFN